MRYMIALLLCLTASACKTLSETSALKETSRPDANAFIPPKDRPVRPQVCAAIRGNGNYIFAHWGAMARLLEDFGPIEGVAGGSSGSITSFIYENMYRSRASWLCDGGSRSCSPEEAGLRMSVMMRSLVPYIGRLKDNSGVQNLMSGRNKVIVGLKVRRIKNALEAEDWQTAGQGISALLSNPQLASLVNQDLVNELDKGLENPESSAFAVGNVVGAINALQWKIDESSVLFRRGLLKMSTIGEKIGVFADFYAGIEGNSAQELGHFLDQCAKGSRGMSWLQLAMQKTGDGKFCGELFNETIDLHYKRVFESVEEDGVPVLRLKYQSKSIDEPVGRYLPVIAGDSFFKDPAAISTFKAANQKFRVTGMPPEIGFDINWLKFGYYARSDELKKVLAGAHGRTDTRSRMADGLGERTWREILAVSPLEPGLESAQCLLKEGTASKPGEWRSISDVRDLNQCIKISTGGWSDLEPVAVLKDIGCQKVIMIHRAGPATSFAQKMIKFLSKNDVQYATIDKELFDLSRLDSSYSQSIGMADGVVCTNWDTVEQAKIMCMVQHSYDSKIQTSDPMALRSAIKPYARPFDQIVDANARTYGCRLGAKPTDMPADVVCPPEPGEESDQ